MHKIDLCIDNENNWYITLDNAFLFKSSRTYKRSEFHKFLHKDQNKYELKKIFFRRDLSIQDKRKVLILLEKIAQEVQFVLTIEDDIYKDIETLDRKIKERINLGKILKNREYEKDNNLILTKHEYIQILNKYIQRPLKEKQIENSFFSLLMRNSCNYSVPGAGKTATVLGTYAYLYDKKIVDKIVVICPKNSFDSWANEWKSTFGSRIRLNLLKINFNLTNKSELISKAINKNLIIINYEKANSFKYQIKKIIDSKTLVIFDEIHKIKNPEGVRAKSWLNIIEESKPWGTIQLTGTPIPNSYKDVLNYAKLIFGSELKHYFNHDSSELNSQNLSEHKRRQINNELYPFFVRTSKSDLNIPEPLEDRIIISQATDEENEAFRIIKNSIENPLIRIIRLLQLESNPELLFKSINWKELENVWTVLDNETRDIEQYDYTAELRELLSEINTSSKFNKLINLVSKLKAQNKKIIIWCVFAETINKIHNRLNELLINSEMIYGATADKDRTRLINAFNNNEIDVLITNPHTLAESVSFHKVCHDAIYYELSYNLVHFLQSKNRIHRLGLTNKDYTQYYIMEEQYNNFIYPFSLSNRIYERLQEKEEVMLNAVERQDLETNVFSTDEDIKYILDDLK
ncbi:DEAD/DEAH box helicase [Mycoplasma sp. Mirounga ES2805-ORL]|uniref:SNF2-related protein n=1 Tax=Mycoplasma sp. Mirounga ES2805-ORL TaxID=754514 RepID=UPI00197B9E1A|nr:DEAD/DEAH box helicase [Mycoplasma sp. Mirounga ES2805-ORL]QSF13682.1 DEAD/DEAH box helicase [Mycoplasma sp. Mirounga ES2805-ORL]